MVEARFEEERFWEDCVMGESRVEQVGKCQRIRWFKDFLEVRKETEIW
jgi:hypothetical protein